MRIGFGYDVHRLVEGRKLIIGGVQIEHTHGLLGHSDADVLIHAICDALLGAAGLRDIGHYFPDNDERFKDADSKVLLARTVDLVRNRGYEVVNIDSTVCAEKPKINPHIDEHTVCRYRNKGYDKRADRFRRTKRGDNGLCRGFDKKK